VNGLVGWLSLNLQISSVQILYGEEGKGTYSVEAIQVLVTGDLEDRS